MKIKKLTRLIVVLAIVLLSVACDQISKKVVRQKVQYNERIEVLGDSFIITKIENHGAFFGLGSNLNPILKKILLQIMPLLVLFVLIGAMLFKNDELSTTRILAFSFILGGGLGNIIDRILYDSVTDFLFIDLGFFRTGIFNIADMAVMTGTIMIVINSIFMANKQKQSVSA